jgi:hypothetical protein
VDASVLSGVSESGESWLSKLLGMTPPSKIFGVEQKKSLSSRE